ncbi:MAG TPA: hypothetical protein VKN18_25365 [Blastocatellia bacterium]|nr:hypothetical protein [Blastocatellia bacterium]
MGRKKKSSRQEQTKLRVFCSFLWFFISAWPLALAQSDYIDKANGFKIRLTGNWRAETYTDAVGRQKTEFVCESRSQGLLRITREDLRGVSLRDLARKEIANFELCNSCVTTGQEEFAGESLSGIRVTVHYAEGNRRLIATLYFLQERNAAWILRFNGLAGVPGMSQAVTDTVARSFCSVCNLP